jgi:hypothetical protein
MGLGQEWTVVVGEAQALQFLTILNQESNQRNLLVNGVILSRVSD